MILLKHCSVKVLFSSWKVERALLSCIERREPIGGVRVTKQHGIHTPTEHNSTLNITLISTLPFRTHANIRIAPISHKGTRAALCKATLLGSHLWRCSGCCTPPGHVTCHNTRLSPPNSLLKSTKWDVRRSCFGDFDGICLSICVRGVVC